MSGLMFRPASPQREQSGQGEADAYGLHQQRTVDRGPQVAEGSGQCRFHNQFTLSHRASSLCVAHYTIHDRAPDLKSLCDLTGTEPFGPYFLKSP